MLDKNGEKKAKVQKKAKRNLNSSRYEAANLNSNAYDASSGFFNALISSLIVGVPTLIILFVISYFLFSEDLNFAEKLFALIRRVCFTLANFFGLR